MRMANEQILILEDDLAALNLASKQLTAAGYRVIPVIEGRLGIETCLARLPDLVLCDLNMPGMDGLEFIRRLRQQQFHAPIVVVSAMGRDRCEAAVSAGANTYLQKPIDRKLLVVTVEREIAAAHARRHGRRKHVLVLEEEPLVQRVLRSNLEPARYRITKVENGAVALEIAKNDPPDLVVYDSMVPGVDAMQLLRQLRRELGSQAPILVVSGHTEGEFQRAALDAGASEFLARPAEPSALLARVRELVPACS